MGLGKTLQMISVLLAAKGGGAGRDLADRIARVPGVQLGRRVPAVCSDLRVVLVAGSQEERKRKIEAYQDADVLVTSYDLLKRDIAFYETAVFLIRYSMRRSISKIIRRLRRKR